MNTLRVGYVLRAHGVKGALKVQPLTDDVSRFKRIKELYIEKGGSCEGGLREGGLSESGLAKRALLDVKSDKDFLNIRLEGIDTRDAAEALRGAYLVIERKDAIVLPEGRHFICDLIGCSVEAPDGTRYGVLREILQHGAADVYVVALEGGGELMFPALKRVLLNIDTAQKRIAVDPEALKEVAVDAR